jgi:arylsulfatase A-like enzyme
VVSNFAETPSQNSGMAPGGESIARSAARISTVDILVIAAWFGLATGMIEAVGMLILQELTVSRYVSREVLFVAPTANLIFFLGAGLLLAGIVRLHPRLRTPWLFLCPFAALLFIDVQEVAALSAHVALWTFPLLALGLASVVVRWFVPREQAVLRFWRRSLPWMVAATVVAFVAVQGGSMVRNASAAAGPVDQRTGRPNVLLVILDAVRADHMGAYGYARPTTPNLDRIAREGVLYEHAFSTSPWSLPGHASILAGCPPSELGVGWHNARALRHADYPVLPEVLRSEGYRTGAFSANVFWVTHDRLGRGFTRFDDFYYSIADMVLRTNFGRAFERMVLQRLGMEDIPARRRAPNVNRALLKWIDQGRGAPFFAMVNYFDAHDPYLPPQPYASRFSAAGEAPGIINWRVGRPDPELSPAEAASEIDAYDGSIAYLDNAIAQLRDELTERSLFDNTVVILVSDHGESFGEHGWYLHGHSLYFEQLHVPLIIRWPGEVPAGVSIEQPVSIDDVPAIVMDLVDGPAAFPGPSHAQLWRDATGAELRLPPVVAETEKKPWAPEDSPAHSGWLRSVINQQWHLIESEHGDHELYDWQNDRGEKFDLSTSRGAADIIRRLRVAFPP